MCKYISIITFISISLVCMTCENACSQNTSVVSGSEEALFWIDSHLPGIVVTEGDWQWDQRMKNSGSIPHTSIDLSHSFTTDSPIELNAGFVIIQEVFLDNRSAPDGIMLKLHIKDEKPVTLYWEAEAEAFAGKADYIMSWYMGTLPKAGKWHSLKIDLGTMDMKEFFLEGITFVVNDGRMWWGKTIIQKK